MGIVLPWATLMGFQTYQFGIKPGKLPEPYHYLAGSAAMVLAAIIAEANGTVGVLFAWAIVLGALMASTRQAQPQPGSTV
jgi:hypothetical protein